ncbi:MAG TPA: hypothetical protein VIY28_08375 [Pseudonocardiaceae bacterium]
MLLHRVNAVDRATDGHRAIDGHRGYVVGLQADGVLTDVWNDVRAHLDGRHIAYVPRCECGWTGPPFSSTPSGYTACEQIWRDKHLQPFLLARQPQYGRPSTTWAPRVIPGGLAPDHPPRSGARPQ